MLGFLKRRSVFREFLEAVEISQFPLLENTVTTVTMDLAEQTQNAMVIRGRVQPSGNFFMEISHKLRYMITEDPKRVIYPDLDRGPKLSIFKARCLQKIEDLAPTVCTVMLEKQKLAYKMIDRPLYEPEDTGYVLDEVRALEQFSGQPSIAQLRGLVVSDNPYKTFPWKFMPLVITGFLLDYYSGGSFEQVLLEGKVGIIRYHCSGPYRSRVP
jgi:hypothetical protein